MTKFKIKFFGEQSLLIEFEALINKDIHQKILKIYYGYQNKNFPDIIDIIPSYNSLLLHFNWVINTKENAQKIIEIHRKYIHNILEFEIEVFNATLKKIPVCYDLTFGLDLKNISETKKCSIEEIIFLHTAVQYTVMAIGFIPGFAYMGELDERIRCPRLAQPRTQVPAGSVAIAELQTGIYPFQSPGGWNIIGRTPIDLFNIERDKPSYFEIGDQVQFQSIPIEEFENYIHT